MNKVFYAKLQAKRKTELIRIKKGPTWKEEDIVRIISKDNVPVKLCFVAEIRRNPPDGKTFINVEGRMLNCNVN